VWRWGRRRRWRVHVLMVLVGVVEGKPRFQYVGCLLKARHVFVRNITTESYDYAPGSSSLLCHSSFSFQAIYRQIPDTQALAVVSDHQLYRENDDMSRLQRPIVQSSSKWPLQSTL
jgi:hypothetical protein